MFRRIVAILGASTVAFIALGFVNASQPTHAATVSVSVTCMSSLPEVPISAAQGDTVVVTIDSACFDVNSNAASQTPAVWRQSYFSSWPTLGAAAINVNTFTWVISANAPVGEMVGLKTTLPYVCSNCAKGAFLRFTISATSPTTIAPTTTEPIATTVAPSTTVPVTTTTEPQLVVADATLPEAGANSAQSMWAITFLSVGIFFLSSSRLGGRIRKR